MKTKLLVKFVDLGGLGSVISDGVTKALSQEFDLALSDRPDVVFFSNYGHDYLAYGCVRIFVSCENLPQISSKKCDFAVGSNQIEGCGWYFRWPYFRIAHDMDTLQRGRGDQEATVGTRQGTCIVVSNPMGSERNQFWDCLERRISVSSGGHYRNNVGGPVPDKIGFLKQFKFCVAFENSGRPGYLTEKVFDAWMAGCVPIYWGDPLVGDDLNCRAFINARDFESWESLADHVVEVNNSDVLYNEYLDQPLFRNGVIPPHLQDCAFASAIRGALAVGHRLPQSFKFCQKFLRAAMMLRKEWRSLRRPKWYE